MIAWEAAADRSMAYRTQSDSEKLAELELLSSGSVLKKICLQSQ